MKRQAIFLIAIISAITLLVSWKAAFAQAADNSLQLKLRIDTSSVLDLLDVQDASLDQLEQQYSIMLTQISALESSNKELQLQLSESDLKIKDLEQSLSNISKSNEEQAQYNAELNKRLTEAEQHYKAASIAGPIAGILFASGIALLIYGAVEKNDACTYTGVGLSGATLIVWTTGKVAFKWW